MQRRYNARFAGGWGLQQLSFTGYALLPFVSAVHCRVLWLIMSPDRVRNGSGGKNEGRDKLVMNAFDSEVP